MLRQGNAKNRRAKAGGKKVRFVLFGLVKNLSTTRLRMINQERNNTMKKNESSQTGRHSQALRLTVTHANLSIACVLLALLASCSRTGGDPMTTSLRSLKNEKFEMNFLKQMIQHHRGAIEMAKMVPSRTKRQELNQLGASIIGAQEQEIGQLSQWLKVWHKADPDTMAGEHAGMKMEGMSKLEAAKDTNFDKMFLEMMIKHHDVAVQMSELVKERSKRPELLTFAEKVVKDQTAEIEQMKGWQTDWFKK